ncbi:MAG: DUF167 domain-containing protein [Candidatus Micrarchaeota archaeon]|nr:DUF167 domain-containing protein [Candidatus Micrarchaeota archaeon]MDE1870511.1 DUF167 domain-containing protein [Candidatus Micrarchaeota archaeon]
MEIKVRVTPNSKTAHVMNAVIKIDETNFAVKVNAPATENRANKRLVEIMADYFHVRKSCVKIISGLNSRNKVLEVTK